MDKKYVKVPFSDAEKANLKATAKRHGMKLNEFIRRCVLVQNYFEFVNDAARFERHTNAINRCREEINKLYHSSLEDKILISDTIEQLHKMMFELDTEESFC
jgi:hypothetical protein